MKEPSAPPRITDAEWLVRPATQAVLAALAAGGHEARAVGGAVRNTLMGKPVTDVDIATTATPGEIMALARAAGLEAVPTGIDHGTVTVIAERIPYEVTTLREDVETFGRHATVAFTADWAADARRRDFTMNALYCAVDGTLLDPLGGYPDLVARRVRFIGSADQRIAEDYLRILRFFRFHAEYGEGEPDRAGLEACVRGRAGLAQLSAERVRVEVLKLLAAPGAVAALDAMLGWGLIVPVLGGVPRLGVLVRLARIEAALGLAPDPVPRLGTLALHTPEDAQRTADRLRLSRAEKALLDALAVDQPHIATGMPLLAAKQALYWLGAETWRLRVLRAWALAGAPPDDHDWRELLALPERWTPPVFPLKGADLLAIGLPPGPRVGEVLRTIESQWLAGGMSDSREQLLVKARAML